MKGQPDGRPRCLRCKTIDLTLLDSSTETISFLSVRSAFAITHRRGVAAYVWGSLHQGLEPEFRAIPCRSRLTSPTRLHPLIPCVPHSGLVLPSRLFMGVNAFR